VFAGKKSAQIREILINESAWEEMTCLFALSLIKTPETSSRLMGEMLCCLFRAGKANYQEKV
ncbi:hypothetical protein L6P52_20775, partial [Klebsiella pneumoniae]|nr:hypothetical protein [Klebsiella pneumoniae]